MNLLGGSKGLPRPASLALQWLVVLWAAGLVLYFEFREGLVNWRWLHEPAAGGIFKEKGLPDPRFAPSPRAGVFQEILLNALGAYDISWSNMPLGSLIFGTIMIGLYVLLGWLILGTLEVYLPRVARVCLSLVVGCTVVGIVMELVCMAGLLTQPVVVVVWLLLLGAAFGLLVRHRQEWQMPKRTPDGSRLSPAVRQDVAHDWFRTVHPFPLSIGGKLYFVAASALVAVISFILLLHAIGQPETYWDSLILYMGYAKLMFLEGAFPLKVVGQVGIGLGANYPHLYPVLTAQTAAMAGSWNDIYAQLLPPVAGLVSTMLVFYTVLEISRDRLVAISAALLFRAVPYGLSYTQYASDYAIAILFTTAFLYAALKYVLDGHNEYRWLMLGFAAGAVHINYLMWLLWPVAAVVILVTHSRLSHAAVEEVDIEANPDIFDVLDTSRPLELKAPRFLSLRERMNLRELFTASEFWISGLLLFAAALPWYIRNTVLTGNPVYAFYYTLFRTSKRVNPEVMRSAEREWRLNGDGLWRAGHTLTQKLANSWEYFVSGPQHWKLAPVFAAFVLPGFVFGILILLVHLWASARRVDQKEPAVVETQVLYLVPCSLLFLLLWFYAYCIADFYLYQVIVVLPLFGIFAGYLFMLCNSASARGALYILTLIVGFAPGVVMGLMGFKLKNTGVYVGMPPPQISVTALRKLFMDRDIFYRMEFNGDMEMFGRVNSMDPGTVVLTHENRHLLFDPAIRIVHLDDWEVQQAYRKPAAERLRILDSLGVQYYWYVPNEDKHVINSLVGMDELIAAGHFVEDYNTPASGSSTPELVEHKKIPPNRNVLYRRAK